MDPKLYQALVKADIASVKAMLRESPGCLDGTTAQKNTALHMAAALNYSWSIPEIYDVFNSHMHFQFAANSRGDTPLHLAVRAGRRFMANFLIDSARQSNGDFHLHQMQNENGDTPLHEAARNCRSRIAVELMNADERLAGVINKHGESAVYLAAEREAVEIVLTLLQFPACAFAGPNGQTALHAAVGRNYELVRLLLQANPDLNHQADATGSSPLHYAASMGDHKMVELLLSHDASTALLLDTDGLSPIHVASSMGYTDIISELIKHCPEAVELVDNNGMNLLHVAIENEMQNVMKYVLKNPVLKKLLNEPDHNGNTPLHFATIHHNIEAVQLLLVVLRVDATLRNHEGLTPLDIASFHDDSSTRLRMYSLHCLDDCLVASF